MNGLIPSTTKSAYSSARPPMGGPADGVGDVGVLVEPVRRVRDPDDEERADGARFDQRVGGQRRLPAPEHRLRREQVLPVLHIQHGQSIFVEAARGHVDLEGARLQRARPLREVGPALVVARVGPRRGERVLAELVPSVPPRQRVATNSVPSYTSLYRPGSTGPSTKATWNPNPSTAGCNGSAASSQSLKSPATLTRTRRDRAPRTRSGPRTAPETRAPNRTSPQ